MSVDREKAEEYFRRNPMTRTQAKMALKILRNPLARGAVQMTSGKMSKEQRKELEAYLQWYIDEGHN